MRTVIFWIFAGALLTIVATEELGSTPCDTGRDANIVSTIQNVTVDPCPGAEDGEPCVLFRGTDATVTIRFTPSISPRGKLRSTIAWVKGNLDMNFRVMRPDACTYMSCPVRANQQVTFNSTLQLSSNLPTGTYPLKVKIQEMRGQKRVLACELFTVSLQDPEEEE